MKPPITIETRNHQQIILRRLRPADDMDLLIDYLSGLSHETRSRFGPHPFDREAVVKFYQDAQNMGYIACVPEIGGIVAYCIMRAGYLEHDGERLRTYGVTPDTASDCTFAPSVADAWQSRGIGSPLFQFILEDVKAMNFKRIILWGGVQTSNERAVNYYRKHGFIKLGEFYFNGLNNDDMVWP